MSKRSLASTSRRIWYSLILVFLISTCYSLKCRTDDGPSESELKRITRTCMRRMGEKAYPNNGGSTGSYNNNKHYGPLHQSNFGMQYKSNSRYDYNYDYDEDDNYNGNNNNNYNNNHNNNNYNNNGNYDRDNGNRNVLQHRGRQQNSQSNRADNNNNRSASSSSSSTGNNNGGRYENGNNNGNNHGNGGGGGNGSGNSNSNSGGRSSISSGGDGNSQRGQSQNNNNNSNNNQSSHNDTADAACVVHCFFQEMNMLNSDDYPDRYKVQYGLTRELRDRELRNFYTDTIQDCFQYLESQRRRDKCHYSRDLIHCMSEYAKVNCDDWQEFSVVFN